jgi:hypothetical protein
MSFRQPKSTRRTDERSWQSWLARHDAPLRSARLPPEWTLTRKHWEYFLEHGYVDLDAMQARRAWFGDLPPDQMRALLDLIESSEYADWTMASWLRVRLGQAQLG